MLETNSNKQEYHDLDLSEYFSALHLVRPLIISGGWDSAVLVWRVHSNFLYLMYIVVINR